MNRRNFLEWLVAPLILQSTGVFSSSHTNALKASIPKDVYDDLLLFLGGRSPLTLSRFGGEHSRRDVIEPVLLMKALEYGMPNAHVDLLAFETSHERHLQLIADGEFDLSGTTVWGSDLDSKYLSLPLIRHGEFEAGIYTSPSNKKALKAQSLEEVRNLTFVSSKKWLVDWKTLSELAPKEVFHANRWKFMPKMVMAGRCDVLLAPFQSTKDLSLKVEAGTLIPIPGIKIALSGSRHFAIAQSTERGAIIKNAVNEGIHHFHSEGIIHKAYVESGFFSSRVRKWNTVNV